MQKISEKLNYCNNIILHSNYNLTFQIYERNKDFACTVVHRSLNSNEKGLNIWANVLLQKPVIIGNQVKFPLAVTQNVSNNVALHIEHRCVNPTVFIVSFVKVWR